MVLDKDLLESLTALPHDPTGKRLMHHQAMTSLHSRDQRRITFLVTRFGGQDNWDKLKTLVADSHEHGLDRAYGTFIRTFAATVMKTAFTQAITQAPTKGPTEHELEPGVIEILEDLKGQLLASVGWIDLVLDLEDGKLSRVRQLAERFEKSTTLHHNNALQAAITAMHDERRPQAVVTGRTSRVTGGYTHRDAVVTGQQVRGA